MANPACTQYGDADGYEPNRHVIVYRNYEKDTIMHGNGTPMDPLLKQGVISI